MIVVVFVNTTRALAPRCEYKLSNVLIFILSMESSKEVALKYFELQALEQGSSDREDEFFKRYLKSLGISEPERMTEIDADKLLENLATEEYSEEFLMSLVYWLLHQNISQAALDAILESDIDGDGVPLWQELVEGTNPFVKDQTLVKQTSPELKWSRKNDLEL